MIDWEEWASRHNITMRVEPGWEGQEAPGMENMDAWTVLLKRQARGATERVLVPFYMGRGYEGRAPLIGEVLECLVGDAESIEGVSKEEWIQMMGYAPGDKSALTVYRACVRTGERLERLLGKELLADLKRLVAEVDG